MLFVANIKSRKDQYKKKFGEWYNKGMLPAKKRRKIAWALENGEGVNELKDDGTSEDAVVEVEHRITTPVSTLGHDPAKSMSLSPSKITTEGQDERSQVHAIDIQSSDLTTPRQRRFYRLLTDLWDKYFDAEFGDADHITIGEAVSNMAEFLVEVTAEDPELTTAITQAGDKAILCRVGNYLRPYCSHAGEMWGSPKDYRNSGPTFESLLRQPGGGSRRLPSSYIGFCVSNGGKISRPALLLMHRLTCSVPLWRWAIQCVCICKMRLGRMHGPYLLSRLSCDTIVGRLSSHTVFIP